MNEEGLRLKWLEEKGRNSAVKGFLMKRLHMCTTTFGILKPKWRRIEKQVCAGFVEFCEMLSGPLVCLEKDDQKIFFI